MKNTNTQPAATPVPVPEFRPVTRLLGLYLTISLLSLGATALLANHHTKADTQTWVHAVIVAASAALTFIIGLRAARGHRGAYRRVRIISTVMLIAIVIIDALPGDFPLWMKLEQGACAILLLAVMLITGTRALRTRYATS